MGGKKKKSKKKKDTEEHQDDELKAVENDQNDINTNSINKATFLNSKDGDQNQIENKIIQMKAEIPPESIE